VRLPGSVAVARERNFGRFLLASSISTVGTAMAMVALAFAALDLGGATDLGIILLVREIPLVFFLLLGGVWADRIPRRVILVGTDVVRGFAQAGTAVLLFSGHAELWNVAVLQTLFGVAMAFSRPAQLGLLQEAVSQDRLQEANALLGLSRSTLFVIGPAIGALIVAVASPAWALAVDAGSFAGSALLIASMQLPRLTRAAKTTVLADLRDGWREFTARPWVVAMVASFGVFQLSYFPALFVLGPLVAKSELGGAGAWGAILSAQAVGAILGGLVALRVRFRRPLVACALLAAPSGAILAMLALPAPTVVIAAVALFASACLSIDDTVWSTVLQQQIPPHAISRIASIDWFGSVALNPIGYALVAPLAAHAGVSATLACAAVLNSSVGLALLAVPAVRTLDAATPPVAVAAQE
jgi:MFS family permease